MKICTRCKDEKSWSEFGKNKKFKDGLSIYCKGCSKEKCRLQYAKHRGKRQAAARY